MFNTGIRKRRAAGTLLLLVALGTSATAVALEDPMRPATYAGHGPAGRDSAVQGLELTSILVAAERRVAVVNGRRLTVGASLDGARVVAIAPTYITLRREGRTARLRLLPLDIKERSEDGKP